MKPSREPRRQGIDSISAHQGIADVPDGRLVGRDVAIVEPKKIGFSFDRCKNPDIFGQNRRIRKCDVATLTVIMRDGTELSIEAPAGTTVMEAIRDAGVPELMASCGGCCACGTCHVKIAAECSAGFPAMQPDERDLLETSRHRDDTSRLSCQLLITPDLNHVKVRIANED